MEEASNIVNNIRVANGIFNCGNYNNIEKSIIKHLKSKNHDKRIKFFWL